MKLLFKAVFFLFIFILVSCKKDKKVTVPPTITYSAPSAGQSLSYVYDAGAHKYHLPINISARVTDPVHLVSVNVSLMDVNHVPLQGSVNIPITSADFVFNIIYDVTDFRLQTGTYLIQIVADDGTSASSSFQPITIIESPSIWWGYCVNTKLNPQNIVMYDTTSGGSMTSILSIALTNTYNGMKYGGYNQQLYVNGNGSMPFAAYNIQNGTVVYNVTATPSEVNYTSLNTDGYKPYIGFRNGDLYSYSNTGMQNTSYRYTGANPSYPYYFTTTSTNNVAIYKSLAPDNDAFVNFSLFGATYNSALLFGNTPIKTVIAVFEKSADSLYVFGNDSVGKGVIDIYRFSTNRFSAGVMRWPDKIMSATKITNQYVAFSTTTGVYKCINFSTPTSLQATSAQKIIYQPKLNVLTVASGINLNAYTISTNSLTAIPKMSLTLSDSIVDFEVITNK